MVESVGQWLACHRDQIHGPHTDIALECSTLNQHDMIRYDAVTPPLHLSVLYRAETISTHNTVPQTLTQNLHLYQTFITTLGNEEAKTWVEVT
jgi:hypothetical protein